MKVYAAAFVHSIQPPGEGTRVTYLTSERHTLDYAQGLLTVAHKLGGRKRIVPVHNVTWMDLDPAQSPGEHTPKAAE
jgi:hypothetical protein